MSPVPGRPTVSVVIPFRDAEATLRCALRSMLAQTWRDLEVVAVADHCTDDSVAVAEAVASADRRVRVLHNRGEGLVDALNTGIAHAAGDWIARMDADDWSHPNRLRAQLALAEQAGADAIATCAGAGDGDELSEGMRQYYEWSNALQTHAAIHRDLFVESPLVHPSVTLRASSIRDVGGYRHGAFPEDYDLWLRLAEAGAKFAKVSRVLLHWRDSSSRLTRIDPRYSAAAFRALKAHHLAAHLRGRGRDEVQIWGAGPDGKAWVPELERRGIRVARFFDIDARKIGNRVRNRIDVLDWRRVHEFRDCFTLAAVGVRGARELIRAELDREGWRETIDYRAVQ